ncbi:MAG: DUF2800 domain-containing protein [Planctomycetota bacterium]
MQTIRASFLAIAAKCPASLAVDEGLRVTSQDADVTRTGSAVHEVCRIIVATSERPQEAVTAAAARNAADPDDVGRMTWRAFQWWDANKGAYAGARTEARMELQAGAYALTGHADVLSLPSGTEARLVDWKSGYLTEADAEPQMRGYALLAARQFGVQTVTATVVWLRDETEQTWTWTAEELAAWWREIVGAWMHWDGNTYIAGDHCRYCPRLTGCPAQRALMRATVADLEGVDAQDASQIEPAKVGAMYGRVQVVEQLCERFRNLARAIVAASGPIPTGDGRELALVEQVREVIDPLAAWDTLLDAIGAEELAGACQISKTAVLSAVSDKASRGQKGKAKDALMGDLRAKGAVKMSTIEQLRLRSLPTDEE